MSSVAAQPDLKCLVERESNRRDDADSSEVSVPPAEGETVHATACAPAVDGKIANAPFLCNHALNVLRGCTYITGELVECGRHRRLRCRNVKRVRSADAVTVDRLIKVHTPVPNIVRGENEPRLQPVLQPDAHLHPARGLVVVVEHP